MGRWASYCCSGTVCLRGGPIGWRAGGWSARAYGGVGWPRARGTLTARVDADSSRVSERPGLAPGRATGG